MIRRFSMVLVPVLALAAGCGGKADSSATPAADSAAAPAPVVADSTAAPVADSGAKPAADSAAKPPASAAKSMAPKAETGDYDKAVRPRFKVDEKTGKIDTIKRP